MTLRALTILMLFAPVVAAVDRPAIISAKEWGSKPQPIADERKQVPKVITVHHAGVFVKSTTDPATFVRNMQAWGQREKKWPDLPYHFLIAPDGRIFEGRPLAYEPESNTKYPLSGHVGVELMGDFTQQRPTQKQLESLVKLVAWVCDQYKIVPDQIAGHKDRAKGQTTCPGPDLDRYIADGTLRGWVADTLAGKAVEVKPGPALDGGPTIEVGDGKGDPKPVK